MLCCRITGDPNHANSESGSASSRILERAASADGQQLTAVRVPSCQLTTPTSTSIAKDPSPGQLPRSGCPCPGKLRLPPSVWLQGASGRPEGPRRPRDVPSPTGAQCARRVRLRCCATQARRVRPGVLSGRYQVPRWAQAGGWPQRTLASEVAKAALQLSWS